jgi:hypothetical protein
MITETTQKPPISEVKDNHSAELKGDKVIVRHDFVTRRLMQESGSTLAVTDKQGRDVRLSMPDRYFGWFNADDLPARLRNGFEIVDPDKIPVIATAQTDYDKKNSPTRIVINDLTLCWLPKGEHDLYVKLHDETVNQRKEMELSDDADRFIQNDSSGIIKSGSGGATITRG